VKSGSRKAWARPVQKVGVLGKPDIYFLTQAISGIWITGKLPVAVKSVAKSVGTVTTQAQAGGGTGITWNGFNLAAGQQATLTLKVARPGKGVQVAYGLYCAFGPGTNATLTTNDVFAP
jgi:hypothetical protein